MMIKSMKTDDTDNKLEWFDLSPFAAIWLADVEEIDPTVKGKANLLTKYAWYENDNVA